MKIIQKHTDAGLRYYDVDGKNYASVTQVVNHKGSVGLQIWRDKLGHDVADFEMKRCAKRGTATHKLIEDYLKGNVLQDEQVLPRGLFNLMKPHLDNLSGSVLESKLCSHKLKIAGTVDCIAVDKNNDKLTVVDFKTSNKKGKVRQEHWLQTTAYALMWMEMYPSEKIEQLMIIKASEDGYCETTTSDYIPYVATLKSYIEDYYKMMEVSHEN